ncbi:MAG: GIY-YIG nuclease family protein [Paracoccaceae bacterium]
MIKNTTATNMLTIDNIPYPIYSGAILPHWTKAAEVKGFEAVSRISDRLHLALRCHRCGTSQKTRVFTLMSAQPQCQACVISDWRADAVAAGLIFLRRDPAHRHYAHYRAPCGHEVRRQTGLVRRIAAGDVSCRCEICHTATEAAESEARGWMLTGADPEGNPNYRHYRHTCGHEQRIARANMQSGRFSCGGCGEAWPAARSFLYAMEFTLASGRDVIKLGFSRDPASRLAFQLQRDAEMPCQILRQVEISSGQKAIRIEKAMHSHLKSQYPDLAVDPAAWQGQIRVKSEIYDSSLSPVILSMLDDLDATEPVA